MFNNTLISQYIEKYNVMAHAEDLLFHLSLIEYNKPDKILELGTGAGAWAMAVDYLIPSSIEFMLIEDFRYIKKGFSPPYYWPRSEEELNKYISSNSSMNYKLFNINAAQAHTLDFTNVSVIRWDCDFEKPKENLLKMINKCDDNLIIIVDDIRPNYCFHRLMTMIDLVNEGVLLPLWFGVEECAFVKRSFNREQIFQYLEKTSDKFTFFEKVNNTFIGKDWEYIRTQDINFFVTKT